jgi:subtilase family serine protease/RNA polymerase subunit RPABC4/transcription elongation factor Spt4
MAFNPWPAITADDNTYYLDIYLGGLILPEPDLTPTAMWTDPAIVHVKDNVTIFATIENVGLWPAIDIQVDFTVGGMVLAPCTIELLDIGQSIDCTADWTNASIGTHLVVVDVDPPIETGGIIQESNEGNNRLTMPVTVEPHFPDLEVFIIAPGQGYPGNTVTIEAFFQNSGNAPVTAAFFIEFFVDQNSLEVITYTLDLAQNDTDRVFADWTPPAVGDYTIRVVIDPTDTVEEISEDNNEDTWVIQVVPVANLVVIEDFVSPDDPCPSSGQDIRANAWISNAGQDDADVFEVAFLIDGVDVGTWTSPGTLAPGATVLATSPLSAPAGPPGYGQITVTIDPTDVVRESDNDDNSVVASYMVYTGSQTIWSNDATLDSVDVSPSDNLVIEGDIVFINSDLTVTQSGPGVGRHYVKIRDGGSLTLINSNLMSNFDNNWPLNVCILDSGMLVADQNSQVLLDSEIHGKGALFTRGNGRLDMTDSLMDGDIRATGFDVSLKNVDLTGDVLFIYTQNTSYIWDTIFWDVNTLSLNTDDGDVGTLDFDIRNVSFEDPNLDQQLVFGGDQWVWLTDVDTYMPVGEDWWTHMIVGNAKVSIYYWLTIELVDGTGALLPASNLTLLHLDPDTLNWSIATDDQGNPIQDVLLDEGTYLYRALSQIRYAIDHFEPWTYMANGSKFLPVEGQYYYPDKDIAGDVKSNTVIQLVFSALTPEFWHDGVTFSGGNGVSYDQPYNWPVDIVAAVHNDGKITTRNVEVYFYATDVDPDGDGIMQNDPSTFGAYLIGNTTIDIPANSTMDAVVTWNPGAPTMIPAGNKVSAIIDMFGNINEVDETNNIETVIVTMFRWPDLMVPAEDIISIPTQVPVGSSVALQANVRNIGSNSATNVRVEFLDNGVSIGNDTIPLIQSSGEALALVDWVAQESGPHSITVIAFSDNLTTENTDYNWDNNDATISKTVLSEPDLMVDSTSIMGLGSPRNVTQARAFDFTVKVYNLGESSVSSFTIEAYLDSTDDPSIASLSGQAIAGNTSADYSLSVPGGIPDTGTYDLIVMVDREGLVPEGNETNNNVTVSLEVIPPQGFITITFPFQGDKFEPGTTIVVRGRVQTNALDPIPDMEVHVQLVDTGEIVDSVTNNGGEFLYTTFQIPDEIDGQYTLRVFTDIVSIEDDEVVINIEKPVSFWDQEFLGLPLWLWLIIIIIVVVIIVAVTVYLKYVGLGKLVECGNCGAFIPESSEKCPKCGVEFERDLAKCSSCGAWIPIGVKVCPECGVEFATGELEMEEYREKMRMQYDEVVAKFRAEADKALGRTLSEKEFQDWWMTQPTFVTFEEWLREEEEMRKMGSRPCPSCGTLNSVTAKVCHKCGTLFEEIEEAPAAKPPQKKPPAKPAAAPPAKAPAAPQPAPEGELESLEKPVPKKVVKKPVDRPVVQKKVIKKPVSEEETEGGL